MTGAEGWPRWPPRYRVELVLSQLLVLAIAIVKHSMKRGKLYICCLLSAKQISLNVRPSPRFTMSIETAPTAPKTIRLERLDGTTPHATFVEIFKLFNAAFGSDSSIWTHMYPPPRPPLEHMADVGAYQHMMDVLNPKLVYVAAYAELPDGTERLAGMAVWGSPGYRYKPLVEDKMSEEEKHAYQGYNLPFRNTFRSTLQSHRDTLMGNETYWCVLSKVLSQLWADDLQVPERPCRSPRLPEIQGRQQADRPRHCLGRCRIAAASRPLGIVACRTKAV